MNRIWVVEMYDEAKGKWDTTVGIGLNRARAYMEKNDWESRNPDDKFRVVKYVPIDREV